MRAHYSMGSVRFQLATIAIIISIIPAPHVTEANSTVTNSSFGISKPRVLPIADIAATAPEQKHRNQCPPSPPLQAEGIAIARTAFTDDGRVVEVNMLGGNVSGLFFLKQFGVTTAVRPKKAGDLMAYPLGDQNKKFILPGIVPGGPLFVWIIRDYLSGPAIKDSNGLVPEAGKVYVWATDGKKVFPRGAVNSLHYLCDFDQNASDEDLKTLFLKQPHSRKQHGRSSGTHRAKD